MGEDNGQMWFGRLNMKCGIVALSQKVIESYNQNFRSERDLRDQLIQPQHF